MVVGRSRGVRALSSLPCLPSSPSLSMIPVGLKVSLTLDWFSWKVERRCPGNTIKQLPNRYPRPHPPITNRLFSGLPAHK